MRRMAAGLVAVFFAGATMAAQPPARARQGAAAPQNGASAPSGNLAQMMRGILFPSSNLLFDVQSKDPGAPAKPSGGTDGPASQTYASVYTGWQIVEGAAAALEDSADLILKPGRVC